MTHLARHMQCLNLLMLADSKDTHVFSLFEHLGQGLGKALLL